MKIESFEDGREFWTVETLEDLQGWELFYLEAFKPGVLRLHVFNQDHTEQRQLYCQDTLYSQFLEACKRDQSHSTTR